MKKLIPKLQSAWSPIVLQSDNTYVQKPIINTPIEYTLLPDEFYINTGGKNILAKANQTEVKQDNRSLYLTKLDLKRSDVLRRQHELLKLEEENMKALGALGTMLSPSTYVGPIFNNNGKSYVENVISGEGTGNNMANFALDILVPIGAKGLQYGYKSALYGLAKAGNNWARANLISKELNNSPIISNTLKLHPNRITINNLQTISTNLDRTYDLSKSNPTFKSELDWSPESWFRYRVDGKYTPEDVAALKSHVPEYLDIERQAKQNKTWLKNADGSEWEGAMTPNGLIEKDPRVWVMQLSKAGLNLDLSLKGYNGINEYQLATFPDYQGRTWTSKSPDVAKLYRSNSNGRLIETYPLKSTPKNIYQGHRNSWEVLPYDIDGNYLPDFPYDLDENLYILNKAYSDYLLKTGQSGVWSDFITGLKKNDNAVIIIKDIKDGKNIISDDIVYNKGIPRITIFGNNGNLTGNKNIYRGLIPLMSFGLYKNKLLNE